MLRKMLDAGVESIASEELSQSIARAYKDFVPTDLICYPHTRKARLRDFEAQIQEQQERGYRRHLIEIPGAAKNRTLWLTSVPLQRYPTPPALFASPRPACRS